MTLNWMQKIVQGWRACIAGNALALLMAKPDSVPGTSKHDT